MRVVRTAVADSQYIPNPLGEVNERNRDVSATAKSPRQKGVLTRVYTVTGLTTVRGIA
jgi:hypothetical protein